MLKRNSLLFLSIIISFSLFASLRVVSLAPSLTEIIAFIGGDSLLVGVSSFCNYPEYIDTLPKVGGFNRPSMEKLLQVHPDVVFMMKEENKIIKEQIETMGIDVIDFKIEDMEDLKGAINDIGHILNIDLQYKLDSLMRIYKELKGILPDKKFIVEISAQPFFVAGNESFINKIIEWAGMKRSYDLPFEYGVLSDEMFFSDTPDYIIVAHEGKSRWENMDIEKLYFDNEELNILLRPGPRMLLIPSLVKNKIDGLTNN